MSECTAALSEEIRNSFNAILKSESGNSLKNASTKLESSPKVVARNARSLEDWIEGQITDFLSDGGDLWRYGKQTWDWMNSHPNLAAVITFVSPIIMPTLPPNLAHTLSM